MTEPTVEKDARTGVRCWHECTCENFCWHVSECTVPEHQTRVLPPDRGEGFHP